MRLLMLFALVFIGNYCFAQMRWDGAVFLQDGNGNWVDLKPLSKIEGSPFFNDSYTPARLTVGTRTYTVLAKLNLFDNNVYFDNQGSEMVSSKPVDKVEFLDNTNNGIDLTFKSGFPSVGKNTGQSFYLVLDSGKATLLKHLDVRERQTIPYNTATRVTYFDKHTKYYVFMKNAMHTIKNTGDLLDLMKDRKKEIKSYMSTNKTKNKETGMVSLVGYYNSL